MKCIGPIVWKTHAVDQRLILREAEDTRSIVAWLFVACNGPGLNKAKSQRGQSRERDAIFIEAACQADRIGEMDAKDIALQAGSFIGVAHLYYLEQSRVTGDPGQAVHHPMVRALGIVGRQTKQYRANDRCK